MELLSIHHHRIYGKLQSSEWRTVRPSGLRRPSGELRLSGRRGFRIPLAPLTSHVNHAPPLPPGIQAGMAHFSIMWQGSPDMAHSQLKRTLNREAQLNLGNKIRNGFVCLGNTIQYCLASIITKAWTCAGNQVTLSFLQPRLKKVETFAKTYQAIFT